MDEARVERLGLTPLDALLADIDAIRDQTDLQRSIGRLHALAIPVAFGVVGVLDNHEPERFIANVVPGELGLSSRDAYLQGEPRFSLEVQSADPHLDELTGALGRGLPGEDHAGRPALAEEPRGHDLSHRSPARDHDNGVGALQGVRHDEPAANRPEDRAMGEDSEQEETCQADCDARDDAASSHQRSSSTRYSLMRRLSEALGLSARYF